MLPTLLDTEKLTQENDIYSELSLESILAEYADFDAGLAAEGSTSERSKQIVYEALGETEFSGGLTDDDAALTEDAHEPPAPETPEPYPAEPERAAGRYTRRLRRGIERFGRRVEPPAEPESAPEPEGEPDFASDDDVKVYRPASAPLPEGDEDVKVYGAVGSFVAEAERRSARWSRSGQTPLGGFEHYEGADFDADVSDGNVLDYSAGSDLDDRYAAPDSENAPRRDYGEARRAGPVLGFLAALGLRLRRDRAAGEAVTIEDAEEFSEELPPKKAAKYYAGSVNSLRVRVRLALIPMLALLWVTLGLPSFGSLGTGLRVTSLACLVLQLAIVMLGLDVFTAGVMSLVRGRPSMWSLCALANVAAALDAAVAYAVGTAGWGFPMCACAALSMFFALWGALLESRALRFSAKALALSEDPMIVTAETGVEGREGAVLVKSRRDTAGWLRRCEEPDGVENVFAALAPWLILGSLVLSLAAAVISRQWTYFFRILACSLCAAAPAGAFTACALPYFLLALRAYRMGAAVAGWPGMRDIGRALGMVITDSDLFPGGSVKISSIRVLDGASPEDIIADAGSVIIASGSGLSPVFSELMSRNGCAMRRVEDFCCHEGGGLTALIAGEEVLCGSAGFMRLMGVMVPQKLADKSAVFLAVNGVLSGIFNIEYTPVKSVERALFGCLRTRRAPIFAVRDFLVTPMMLHRKYRVPAEGFDFPLFAVRYAVSATEPAEGSAICALLGREGLGGFMEVSGCGRRAYIAAGLAVTLSAVMAVVGVLAAFILYAFSGGLTAAWLLAITAVFTLPALIAALAGCAR